MKIKMSRHTKSLIMMLQARRYWKSMGKSLQNEMFPGNELIETWEAKKNEFRIFHIRGTRFRHSRGPKRLISRFPKIDRSR